MKSRNLKISAWMLMISLMAGCHGVQKSQPVAQIPYNRMDNRQADKERSISQGINYKSTHAADLMADRQLAKPIVSI